jgi:hypothetical protein
VDPEDAALAVTDPDLHLGGGRRCGDGEPFAHECFVKGVGRVRPGFAGLKHECRHAPPDRIGGAGRRRRRRTSRWIRRRLSRYRARPTNRMRFCSSSVEVRPCGQLAPSRVAILLVRDLVDGSASPFAIRSSIRLRAASKGGATPKGTTRRGGRGGAPAVVASLPSIADTIPSMRAIEAVLVLPRPCHDGREAWNRTGHPASPRHIRNWPPSPTKSRKAAPRLMFS